MQDFMKNSARPLITIVGMVMFGLNYTLIPIILRFMGKDSTAFNIPSEWIIGYFAVVGVYSIGRSFEKGKGAETSTEEKKD